MFKSLIKASKDTVSFLFILMSKSFKTIIFECKMPHGSGGQKRAKKCRVLFNWPLRHHQSKTHVSDVFEHLLL